MMAEEAVTKATLRAKCPSGRCGGEGNLSMVTWVPAGKVRQTDYRAMSCTCLACDCPSAAMQFSIPARQEVSVLDTHAAWRPV